ncbi:MAG: aminotransferase class V-fold PLP-dependent enzyme [Rubellimicrobium sp.]|nr:aminotransferase class V-fold PLP-dependent enzyme [Rubellimicrobium sp.]
MTASVPGNSDIRARLGLRPVINVAGTMTALGASIIHPEAVAAMAAIAGEFVEIDDLQRRASACIARATGAGAGFVTASSSAAITLAVAGTMTGADLHAIERLPRRTGDNPREVILQAGHAVNYGAPVAQAVRLAGARVVLAGDVGMAMDYHVAGAITERTAAVLHVVSHHVMGYGQLSLSEVVAVCRPRRIPVIVDAASEYDLRGFLTEGADLVIYSGHKFLSGPTSGIVAGRKDLVRAAYLQNRGIGRGMKVGKESVAGVMAALDAWAARDHAAIRTREGAALALWRAALDGQPGIAARIVPDPTGNPLDRLEVAVTPESGFSAAGLARALAAGTPPVIVRDDEADLGHIHLDPCNLHEGEAATVADALRTVMAAPRAADALAPAPRDATAALRWPD